MKVVDIENVKIASINDKFGYNPKTGRHYINKGYEDFKNMIFTIANPCKELTIKKKTIKLPIEKDLHPYDIFELVCWHINENIDKYFKNTRYLDGYYEFVVKKGKKYSVPFWIEAEHCDCCGGEKKVGFSSEELEDNCDNE